MQKNDTAPAAPAPDGLPAPQRYWSMAAILIGISLTVLDSTIVNLGLPDITRQFGASPAAAVWVVNAYQLATLTLLLPCAQLGERFGYRRVYLTGLTVFTLASLACGLSNSFGMLATSRAVQGLGAAGMMAVNAALVRLTYPSEFLGRGMALNSLVVATSSVAGPSIAAVILSVASWPWLFVVQFPIGALLMWIARRSLPFNPVRSTSSSLRPLDVVMNMAMFALVFLGADAFGVHEGGGTPTLEMLLPGLAMLGAGLVVGFLYVRRSLHRAAPLFPVDLLRIPVFALSMCTSVTAFAAQTLAYVALPFMLLEGQGRSHFEAGLVFTAWPVAIVVTAPIAGRLIARHPGGLLGGIGLSLLALGLALTATMPAHPESWQVAWRLAVCGAGFGIFQSPNNHTIVMSAPLRRAGAASGMLGTARLTGQSLGAVMLGFIFGLTGVQHGSIIALGLAAVMAAASAVFSLLRIRETGTPALPQGSH